MTVLIRGEKLELIVGEIPPDILDIFIPIGISYGYTTRQFHKTDLIVNDMIVFQGVYE